MSKKNKIKVTIMLDPDVKDAAASLLVKTGMSLSGFINMCLATYVDEMQGVPFPDKPIGEFTLDELGCLMSRFLKPLD